MAHDDDNDDNDYKVIPRTAVPRLKKVTFKLYNHKALFKGRKVLMFFRKNKNHVPYISNVLHQFGYHSFWLY